MAAITITDLNNAKTDVDTIAAVANSEEATAATRLGGTVRTLAGMQAEIETIAGLSEETATLAPIAADITAAALIAADITANAANGANITIAAGAATAIGTVATNIGDVGTVAGEVDAVVLLAANITKLDQALAATKIYADTTAGLAAVSSGEYFYVPSTEPEESLILYKDNAGVAVEVKRYLSSEALSVLDLAEVSGVAWAVADASGQAALAVLDDGTVEAGSLSVTEINGYTEEEVSSTFEAGAQSSTDEVTGIAWAVADPAGRVALAVLDNGTASAPVLETASVNDVPVYKFLTARAGEFYAEVLYFNNMGQSLAEGSNGTITTAQEYDNIGFAAHASSPAATVTLTVANTQYNTRGESPMYGALGHLKELVQEECALAYGDQSWQLLACNNGYSGFALSALNKGTAPYTAAISQVQAGYDIAQADGNIFKAGAMFWTQGESNTSDSMATYRDALKLLALDWDTDTKAITAQSEDVPTICYQTASMTSKNVALGQLAAANESDLIYMACPMYQFDYYDTQHITAESAKWLGGYYGLVAKRVLVDQEDWSPVQPVSHVKQGAVLIVKFTTPMRPLVLDTALIPAQTNYGFTLVDSSDVAITISSVAVVGPDTVKIVAASTIPSGAKLRYGFNTATGKGTFTGSCGNLRDSQGDHIVYDAIGKPMHNWCAIFEYTIS